MYMYIYTYIYIHLYSILQYYTEKVLFIFIVIVCAGSICVQVIARTQI